MNAQCNQVTVVGIMASDFVYSHEYLGEKFFTTILEVERISETKDYLPIIISEKLIDRKMTYVNSPVCVIGQFRSYNQGDGTHKRLVLNIFAQDFYLAEPQATNNAIISGYLCKPPTYRLTPFGRQIADILLAVPRPSGKSDYIPCIAWGRNAVLMSNLDVGTPIAIEGRIQSREYVKMVDDVATTKTAYEVSISSVRV